MLSARSAHQRVAAVLAHVQPISAWRRSVPGNNLRAHRSLRALATASAPLSSSGSRVQLAPTGRIAQQKNLPLLPPQMGKDIGRLTVVLDMDETLLHSSLTPLRAEFDPRSVDDHADATGLKRHLKRPEHVFEIGESKQDRELVSSSIRPGLRNFLIELSKRHEPILFTSALPIYAQPLLDLVEGTQPDAPSIVEGDAPIPAELHPVFRHRLFRPATVPAVEIDYGYVKDVRLLGRDMRRTILVDNSVHACVHTPDNCIVVPDYLGAKQDRVFAALLQLLDEAAQYDDVRPFLRAKMRVREQLQKQGFKFPGMPKEGEDITLPAPAQNNTGGGEGGEVPPQERA